MKECGSPETLINTVFQRSFHRCEKKLIQDIEANVFGLGGPFIFFCLFVMICLSGNGGIKNEIAS